MSQYLDYALAVISRDPAKEDLSELTALIVLLWQKTYKIDREYALTLSRQLPLYVEPLWGRA